jgi:hypothetical protein
MKEAFRGGLFSRISGRRNESGLEVSECFEWCKIELAAGDCSYELAGR